MMCGWCGWCVDDVDGIDDVWMMCGCDGII